MNKFVLPALAFVFIATPAIADHHGEPERVIDRTYQCTHPDTTEQRFIVVDYTSNDARVPCEVRYIKPNEETSLWRARNQVGYCEEKAESFAIKLAGWGWNCELQSMDTEMNEDILIADDLIVEAVKSTEAMTDMKEMDSLEDVE